jgi:hypothetical protein
VNAGHNIVVRVAHSFFYRNRIMPQYSQRSLDRLTSRVHKDLQSLFLEVGRHYDCTIIGGIRTIEEQRSNVAKKLSRTMDSLHLPQEDGLSHAIDGAPYPMPDDWDSLKAQLELVYFAGKVMEIGACHARARQDCQCHPIWWRLEP